MVMTNLAPAWEQSLWRRNVCWLFQNIWSCVTLSCNHNDVNKKQQTARLISLALEIESKLFPIIVA